MHQPSFFDYFVYGSRVLAVVLGAVFSGVLIRICAVRWSYMTNEARWWALFSGVYAIPTVIITALVLGNHRPNGPGSFLYLFFIISFAVGLKALAEYHRNIPRNEDVP